MQKSCTVLDPKRPHPNRQHFFQFIVKNSKKTQKPSKHFSQKTPKFVKNRQKPQKPSKQLAPKKPQN